MSLCLELLLQKAENMCTDEFDDYADVTVDGLVIGAIEEAFHIMVGTGLQGSR